MTDTAVIFDIIGRDRTSAAIAASGSAFNKFALGLAAGAAFAGAKFVDMAANFQQGMTRLKTGAGEVDSNMKVVSDGILTLAGQVGEKTQDLLKGMYLIESAGFHGAQGLDVLKVAAEGAKVGNADMATVADAVTTALNAYHQGADQAAAATNALIAAEGQGKTNLEALSASLSTVAPIASLAHISLNEVLGAMATMTGQGTDAASAATYLKQTIGQLSNPTAKARAEMQSLGLDATVVSMNLGKNGLASTLQMLTDAIQNKMGPAGTVLIDQLRKAGGDTTKFQQILANLPPTQQTFIGALATMTGGTKSMQAALELTGANMQTFQHNTDVINEKVKAGGQNIEGWADVQKNFNQRMAEARGTVEALGIRIGQVLLPKAQAMLDVTMKSVTWLSQHKAIAQALAITVGTLAAGFVAWRIAVVAIEVGMKIAMVATKLWTAAQWLLNLAMDANPVGLIIVAIGLVVAIVALLWTHSAGFRNFFIGMWKEIWGFLKAVGGWFAGPFANFFVSVWHVIAESALWLWHNVIKPFVDFFVDAWKVIAAAGLWLWHNVIQPMVKGFEIEFGFAKRIITSFINLFIDIGVIIYNKVYAAYIKPAIQNISAMVAWLQQKIHMFVQGVMIEWHAVQTGLLWLWHTVFEPVVHGIAASAIWLYNNGILPLVHLAEAGWHMFADGVNWLWHVIIDPVFQGIVGVISWAVDFVHGKFDTIMAKVHEVGDVFSKVFHAVSGYISEAFSGVTGIIKGAINDVVGLINSAINFVNHNFIDAANKLPGVNFPHIPNLPYLAKGGNIVQSGFAVVGDNGPEIVHLPSGASVTPLTGNSSGSAPGGGPSRMQLAGNLDGAFATLLKKLIRHGDITFHDSNGQVVTVT
jgi:TP901 family phage tail tape measure protein